MKQRNTISKKLILYYVLFVMLPMFVLSFVMQNAYRKSILNMAEESGQMALQQINANIDKQFEDYDNLAYFMTRDRQLQDLSEVSVYRFNADETMKKEINWLINGYRTSIEGAQVVGITFESGLTITSDYSDAAYGEADDNWVSISMNEPDQMHVFNYYPGEGPFTRSKVINNETISICHAIRNQEGNVVGVVNVLVYNRVLEQSMSNILGRKGSYAYIVSANDKVVYSPVVQSIPELKDPAEYRTVRLDNEKMGWTLVAVIQVKDALGQINSLQGLFWIVLLLSSVFMAISAIAIGSSLVRPIQELRGLMKQAEEGELSVRFTPKSRDEVNDLGTSFNVMIEKIELLIKQVYDVQKAKRKAEMAALQANIKPHFLYNTLDTIDWMAKKYKAQDIMTTVEALSTLFRVALSKGRDVIPLAQEVLHVQSYLAIQKVRYEDLLEYTISMAEDCRGLCVQKLILQPLVENSIYHGIKESGHNGHIDIKIWQNESALCLSVEDNGIGMRPERLEQVREAIRGAVSVKSDIYGIENVHQRIVLNYGDEFGLKVASVFGTGTATLIRHPILQNDEENPEKDNDQTHHSRR